MPAQRSVSQMTVARVPARGPLLPAHQPPLQLQVAPRFHHPFQLLPLGHTTRPRRPASRALRQLTQLHILTRCSPPQPRFLGPCPAARWQGPPPSARSRRSPRCLLLPSSPYRLRPPGFPPAVRVFVRLSISPAPSEPPTPACGLVCTCAEF